MFGADVFVGRENTVGHGRNPSNLTCQPLPLTGYSPCSLLHPERTTAGALTT